MSYAAVFDLFTDTGINQNQYGWFVSMFYLAYLVAEYPWSYVVQRTLMAKAVSVSVIVWGVILMVTAACHDFSGLAACRFFLGIFEAPITPCFMMIVGMWYGWPPFRNVYLDAVESDFFNQGTQEKSSPSERAFSIAATVLAPWLAAF
jgi:MFS family permease